MRLWRSGSALGFFMNARSSPSRRPRRPHMGSLLADQQDKQSGSYQQGKQNTDDERNNRMPTRLDLFRSRAFLRRSDAQPEEKLVHRQDPLHQPTPPTPGELTAAWLALSGHQRPHLVCCLANHDRKIFLALIPYKCRGLLQSSAWLGSARTFF